MHKLGFIFSFAIFASFNSIAADLSTGKDSVELKASDAVYRTWTTEEPYQSTCYETVEVPGACRTVSENRCRKVSGVGEECWKEETEICDGSSTRTVSYSCIEYRTEYHSEFDHYAQVEVTAKLPSDAREYDLTDCKINVGSVTDYGQDLYVNCENTIVKAKLTTTSAAGYTRKVEAQLSFEKTDKLKAMLKGLSALAYADGKVQFTTADLRETSNFKLKALVKRDRVLLSDKTLLDRELTTSELEFVKAVDGAFQFQIDLAKLAAGFDETKRHKLELKLETKEKVDTIGIINRGNYVNELNQSLKINN